MYPEEQQQGLAAGVACGNATDAIMQFLVSKTALHDSGAEVADDSARCGGGVILILGLGTFSCKTGGDTVFRAVLPVLIVGVDCISSDLPDIDSGEFLLILNALFETHTLVEGLEGMMLDERDAVNLDVVDLGPELDPLVLLAAHCHFSTLLPILITR